MQSIVWTGPRQMEVQTTEIPQPGLGEVLIKVHSVGICGSELSGFLGENSLRIPPLIMGHEFSGKIVALGNQVNKFKEEDTVTVNPLITCGSCYFCWRGQENLCIKRKLIGVHQSGAFAEYVVVPASNCFLIPDESKSLLSGSLTEPLACSVRTAALGGVTQNSQVFIIGAGAIGLLSIVSVKEAGGKVILVSEVNKGRLATAVQWGAQNACDPGESNPVEMVKSLSGGLGADVVIDAVGSSSSRQAAIQAVRLGGTVVWIGLHTADTLVPANHIVRSEIHITGSFAYTTSDFNQAVNILKAGKVQPTKDWLEERSLDRCSESFIELIDKSPKVAKIILHP